MCRPRQLLSESRVIVTPRFLLLVTRDWCGSHTGTCHSSPTLYVGLMPAIPASPAALRGFSLSSSWYVETGMALTLAQSLHTGVTRPLQRSVGFLFLFVVCRNWDGSHSGPSHCTPTLLYALCSAPCLLPIFLHGVTVLVRLSHWHPSPSTGVSRESGCMPAHFCAPAVTCALAHASSDHTCLVENHYRDNLTGLCLTHYTTISISRIPTDTKYSAGRIQTRE